MEMAIDYKDRFIRPLVNRYFIKQFKFQSSIDVRIVNECKHSHIILQLSPFIDFMSDEFYSSCPICKEKNISYYYLI